MGTRHAAVGKGIGFQKDDSQTDYDKMRGRILDEMKKTFNPELINRIDETIIFHALEKEHIFAIIDILIKDLVKRMTDKNIALNLNQDAREYLLEKGWDPNFGARPLKRALQKYLEDPMSEEILKGEYTVNFRVEVSRHPDEDRLKFEITKLETEEMEPEKSNASD